MSPSLELSAQHTPIHEVNADLVALIITPAAWSGTHDTPELDQLDEALSGQLRALAQAEGFKAQQAQTFVMHTLGKLPMTRVALVGVEPVNADEHALALRFASAKAARLAANTRSETLWVVPGDASLRTHADQHLILEGAGLGAYTFTTHKGADDETSTTPDRIVLHGDLDPTWTRATVTGTHLARDLANQPPNIATPSYLAEAARDIAQTHGLDVNVIRGDDLYEQGFQLLHAVGKGSAQEPCLIHLTYTPQGESRGRVAFIGKGVTFDTGGYSIKTPNTHQIGMQLDMSGGAAVLGVAKVLGLVGCPWTVDLFVAAAENAISGRAYKVTDVFKGYGGKTVEIINTDAEGRLCMADALAYATERNPDVILNAATLTGSSLVALGEKTAAVIGNHQGVIDQLLARSRDTGESIWQLPLDERLREKLKSPVADTRNCSTDRWGGAITAALFLSLWVKDTPWAHLDIAGPAMVDTDNGLSRVGGSGFGVALVSEFLRRLESPPNKP